MIEKKNRESLPRHGTDSRFRFCFHFPSPPRRAALKEQCLLLICRAMLPRFTPVGAMLDDPVRQRLFKANVAPGLLGFDPFVLEDFFALGLKLAVKRRVLQKIIRRWFLSRIRHKQHQFVTVKLIPS